MTLKVLLRHWKFVLAWRLCSARQVQFILSCEECHSEYARSSEVSAREGESSYLLELWVVIEEKFRLPTICLLMTSLVSKMSVANYSSHASQYLLTSWYWLDARQTRALLEKNVITKLWIMPYSKCTKADKAVQVEDVIHTICILITEIPTLSLFDSKPFVYKWKMGSLIW